MAAFVADGERPLGLVVGVVLTDENGSGTHTMVNVCVKDGISMKDDTGTNVDTEAAILDAVKLAIEADIRLLHQSKGN